MNMSWLPCLFVAAALSAQPAPPAPRQAPPGGPLPGLTTAELAAFQTGKTTFEEVDQVVNGLGPRFNLNSCAGCHAHPSTGGTSPAVNPQAAVAVLQGAQNALPTFVQPNGPIRVARFIRNADGTPDGGVHDLFVIAGRADAPAGCMIKQPDFSDKSNLALRIPTPTFGLGLIEALADATLQANLVANAALKQSLGIAGRFNTNGNDGTITRFGWKAQNKSLLLFGGEAYNVEMGVTNELFPQEREGDPACTTNATPEDSTNLETSGYSDIQMFALYMRYSAPPTPGPANPSADRGRNVFNATGCVLCHTPMLRTGNSRTAALANQDVHLFSDLAIHHMGQDLADGVSQGSAQGDEFRTAPLWGLRDRLFFLHDGRTADLQEAIRAHDSAGSEAHMVIQNFQALPPGAIGDLIAFLKSL
jgi:CxxC motif-containing protein (DUF1111 family)